MLKILTLILSVILAAPVLAAPPAPETSDRGIFVPGRFSSIAACEDGNIFLLARDQRVVKVATSGAQTSISLPPAANGPAEFSDLTAAAGKLYLCGYPYSDIFALAPEKPAGYTLLKTGAPAKNLLNIAVKGEGFCIRDADFNLYQVLPGKSAVSIDKNAGLESDKSGRTVVIPPPTQQGTDVVPAGRVFKDDGRLFWVAPAPKAPAQTVSLEFLGVDTSDRHIFSVISASGELDAVHTLYAVKRGRVESSMVIPGPDGLEMQHYCRLAPDGTVILVQADPNAREGVWVKHLNLKKGVFIGKPAAKG